MIIGEHYNIITNPNANFAGELKAVEEELKQRADAERHTSEISRMRTEIGPVVKARRTQAEEEYRQFTEKNKATVSVFKRGSQ